MRKDKKNNKSSKKIESITTDIDILKFAENVTKRKYLRELNIEAGIINQAAQMQTAFSFITAAVLMVAPLACQYRSGDVTLDKVLVIFTSILAAMIVSLVCATMSHQRKKHNEEENAEHLNNYIIEKEEWFKDEKYRIDYNIQTNIELQKSLVNSNEYRLKCLRASVYSFYVAIGISIIGFIIYISIM